MQSIFQRSTNTSFDRPPQAAVKKTQWLLLRFKYQTKLNPFHFACFESYHPYMPASSHNSCPEYQCSKTLRFCASTVAHKFTSNRKLMPPWSPICSWSLRIPCTPSSKGSSKRLKSRGKGSTQRGRSWMWAYIGKGKDTGSYTLNNNIIKSKLVARYQRDLIDIHQFLVRQIGQVFFVCIHDLMHWLWKQWPHLRRIAFA